MLSAATQRLLGNRHGQPWQGILKHRSPGNLGEAYTQESLHREILTPRPTENSKRQKRWKSCHAKNSGFQEPWNSTLAENPELQELSAVLQAGNRKL